VEKSLESMETLAFLSHIYGETDVFTYMQVGMKDIFEIHDIAQAYPRSQLMFFDTEKNIEKAQKNFLKYASRTKYIVQPKNTFSVESFSSALKYNKKAFIDYCVFHASGTLEENALAFFLIDTFIKTEGYIDVDEEFIPVLTDIVDNYERYTQCVHNKIYQKIF
jgi:hypothetical protein